MGRDVSEFSEYAAARWGPLFRTAYLLTGDHGLAEDLLQTVLVKCYVAWPRLRAVEAADAYVRKALTNTYISWQRKKSWGRSIRPSSCRTNRSETAPPTCRSARS